jgi:hypothetical protein
LETAEESKPEKGLVELLVELSQRVKSLEEEVQSLRSKYYRVLLESDIDSKVTERVEQSLARKVRTQLAKR